MKAGDQTDAGAGGSPTLMPTRESVVCHRWATVLPLMGSDLLQSRREGLGIQFGAQSYLSLELEGKCTVWRKEHLGFNFTDF